jgi:hypothetical protein
MLCDEDGFRDYLELEREQLEAEAIEAAIARDEMLAAEFDSDVVTDVLGQGALVTQILSHIIEMGDALCAQRVNRVFYWAMIANPGVQHSDCKRPLVAPCPFTPECANHQVWHVMIGQMKKRGAFQMRTARGYVQTPEEIREMQFRMDAAEEADRQIDLEVRRIMSEAHANAPLGVSLGTGGRLDVNASLGANSESTQCRGVRVLLQ